MAKPISDAALAKLQAEPGTKVFVRKRAPAPSPDKAPDKPVKAPTPVPAPPTDMRKLAAAVDALAAKMDTPTAPTAVHKAKTVKVLNMKRDGHGRLQSVDFKPDAGPIKVIHATNFERNDENRLVSTDLNVSYKGS